MDAATHDLPEEQTDVTLDGIAIIGMAGRFPGAADVDTFWANLLAGKDTITRFALSELEASNRDAREASADFVPARGVLDDAALFDAEYFGISPREAERMDPQHRVFLETCVTALDDAGYGAADTLEAPPEIGLFAGCSLNTYLLANLIEDRATLNELTGNYQVGEFQTLLGNDKDFLTTRAAYKLNLRGPCVTVSSACATSLVAIAQASQALLNYQCEMALAGGVSVTFPQHRGHVYQEGGIVSRDGHCRPFDADATGTVFGHGVGVVVLKRLEDALRDGDQIAAVIRGFAVNNDGSAKAGYMAPGVDGQARVIRAAQAMAGVDASSITYIEAHGTGTPLGDPIEIAALTEAFVDSTERTAFCSVGTAKGNVGHLDAAAGVTGLIKTVLSLKHRTLPALAHFKQPNANLDLSASPFLFRAENAAWTADGPLRAGVSAFGVGGVNAHVVLEEAPPRHASSTSRAEQILLVSGRTQAAADAARMNLIAHLAAHPELKLADAAFTLACGRRHHAYRCGVSATGLDDAQDKLQAAAILQSQPRRLAFLFSGQGTQFAGMGHALYTAEPTYREVIDRCCIELQHHLGLDLRTLLYAAATDTASADLLAQTHYAQPAIFVTGLALATLWQSWGITPEAMLGHSLGEYVAATLAGVFSETDALHLIATRGRLMQQMQPGAMLSVALSEPELTSYLDDGLSVAALNGPRASVLAGSFAAITAVEAKLAAANIAVRRLHTSHAFHSALMEPMLASFTAELERVSLHAPSAPFVSSVTGTWITAAEATSAAYWTAQCRQPVRFAAAVETLLQSGIATLLEVGAGDTLVRLAQQQRGQNASLLAIPSFVPARAERAAVDIYAAVSTLHAAGAPIDLHRFFGNEHRLRVSLPTYPFERKLHWIAPPSADMPVQASRTTPRDHIDMSVTDTAQLPAAPLSRVPRLREKIASVLTDLSGTPTTIAEAEHQFLELGFDSLFLTQAAQTLSKTFGLKLTFRQLMEQFPTIASLADHLDRSLPADPPAAVALAAAPLPATAAPSAQAPLGDSAMERLLHAQMQTMTQLFAQQVATLRGSTVEAPVTATPATAPASVAAAVKPDAGEVKHGSFRPIQAKAQQDLTDQQQRYISELTARYAAKTPGSKAQTQAGRTQLADPRAVAGFRPQWKEMVYPLVVERARGSRLWDIDGNEYIDIVNGYGCIMFGHSPDFVVEAARAQLDRGVAIGPQTPLAAEVAALIAELTGNERVTFCNTGSEAVMAAIRVARTVTGRDKLIYFAGDYHGTFDEVLIRSTPRGSAPVAPGIPQGNVTNVTVLEYGADASLDYIRTHADEIAAVLIEPVQTRNPALQPIDFMRAIRTVTAETGSAMIIDEVVTGFRAAPGGVQQLYGIRADMCTYGKVIGGGHPIGVLSGKREYLDALDGGAWQFGDDSAPEVGVTFFAGTFVRHPLALAAARAVLTHLKAAGPALQVELTAKTARLAESLDRFFVERGVPSRIHHFASWFYFTFPHDARLGSLLYYAMRARGIHIQEGYPCFLTTAHTDADLAAVEAAFRETILEMQAAGILPGGEDAAHASSASATPERVPLTAPQREVFLAAALNDDVNCAFNESLTLELRGAIREAELIVAIETVHARHDALRAHVSEDGDSLVFNHDFKGRVTLEDLRGLNATAQQAVLDDATSREAGTSFDLTSGPLVRASYFRLADDHAALLITAHHIILDGWSANQLLEEIGRIYSAGASAQLATLLPFSQYALSENSRDEAGEFADNERFWVQLYKGRTPRLDLPTDRPRPSTKSYQGATATGHLGSELYQQLKQLSARNGCTLYVTLLAGFELLMHRLSGQGEVVVGISTAGQALAGEVSLVGHCVHFLPMLSSVHANPALGAYLKATRSALLDAYDHQEFTYGSVVSKLKLAREPGRLPLIEVQFNLEKVGANVVFDGLTATIKPAHKRFVNTDLFLNVMESADDLAFTCDFNTTLFDHATLDRWMTSWAELLRSMTAATAEAPVLALNVLAPAEHELAVYTWNDTAEDFGPFEPAYAALLRRALPEPDRPALLCGRKRWTCEDLTNYAKALAQRLIAEGLEAGALVGILCRRTPEMVGAMLAVWMAGGAYVPLDPKHPVERTARVLEESGLRLLLTDHVPSVPAGVRAIDLRTVSAAGAGSFEPRALSANDLAYVIYTSGSTGVPKGVAIEHGALRNLLESMRRQPGLTADDVFVAITTLSFDIAALELLLPLLTGATLVIATEDEVVDGMQLLALLERHHATVLQATPGAWRLLLDSGWHGAQPLKALCGGEALPRDLADALLANGAELWNVYGPTETTIWSSATRVTPGSGAPRLGKPIANTQFYVLDEQRAPVPTGVAGELYIGGQGLARGYWQRPELTAEKFTANPFAPGRIYAAGDLARRHADGTLELLGRADFQVKIRGYRIELAEIEAALMKHAAVREAVVVAHRPAAAAAARLIAYLATPGTDANSAQALEQELRPLLSRTLPDYMLPAAYVLLEQLPRTANGKIDRKALPASELQPSAAAERVFVAASTPDEKTLAAIWAELLGLDAVSIEDSIFELGADSLVIFRIAARAQRAGLPVKATDIFENRTIAKLCAALERDHAVHTSATAKPTPAKITAAARDRYRLTNTKVNLHG